MDLEFDIEQLFYAFDDYYMEKYPEPETSKTERRLYEVLTEPSQKALFVLFIDRLEVLMKKREMDLIEFVLEKMSQK